MNTTLQEGMDLIQQIRHLPPDSHAEVILCLPFTHLSVATEFLERMPRISLGAQNLHHEEKGAYTGEISAGMLKSCGVRYVIIGHSERREYAFETDELLLRKLHKGLEHGLKPIFCCGEPLSIREDGKQEAYVRSQLEQCLFQLDTDSFANCVIAYEPIWAIGTGKTATAEQASDMHTFIRQCILERYGSEVASETSILYGGSVNGSNARELFHSHNVDGGLIGGASLKAEEFLRIVGSFPQ